MNQSSGNSSDVEFWRFSNTQIALFVLTAGMLIWAFFGGLENMVVRWVHRKNMVTAI